MGELPPANGPVAIALLDVLRAGSTRWFDAADTNLMRRRGECTPWEMFHDSRHELHAPLTAAVGEVRVRFAGEDLAAHAMALLFAHSFWNERSVHERDTGVCIWLLKVIVHETPPDGALPALLDRIRWLIKFPKDYTHPNSDECLDLLVQLPPSREVAQVAYWILAGQLDPRGPDADVEEKTPPFIYRGRNFIPRLLEMVYEQGWLDEALFMRAFRREEYMVALIAEGHTEYYGRPHQQRRGAPGFLEACDRFLRVYTQSLIRDRANIDPKEFESIRKLRGPGFLGVAAYVMTKASDKSSGFDARAWHFSGRRLMLKLASAEAAEASDPAARAAIVADLMAASPEVLRELVPLAPHAVGVLTEALGWVNRAPLIRELHKQADRSVEGVLWKDWVTPSSKPEMWTADVPAMRAAAGGAGDEGTDEVLRLFRNCECAYRTTLVLFEAARGRNTQRVLKGLEKRSADSVAAFGALPLTRGDEEIRERYVLLRDAVRGAKRAGGSQKQATARSAASAGLANLASNAGMASMAVLEGRVEEQLAGTLPEEGHTWAIAGVELVFGYGASGPLVSAYKGKRALKDVPAAASRDPGFDPVESALAAAKGHYTRLRESVERAMELGKTFDEATFASMASAGAGRSILSRLVLVDSRGVLGLIDGGIARLRAVDGTAHACTYPVRVAHALDLFAAGVLSAWQQFLVRTKTVQPFRQAFRELYVLTPAERSAGTRSTRFVGQVVSGPVAGGLLNARGWQFEGERPLLIFKRFDDLGMRAVLDIPGAAFYVGESRTQRLGTIHFEKEERVSMPGGVVAETMALEQVEPRIFSEVMRDADLIASVAAAEDEGYSSAESIARTADLVEAIVRDLKLDNVHIEGRFAHVKGTRAHYRVHLASGAIHIDPGNHVCIVPKGWATNERDVLIPFDDASNRRISVIISKILLLRDDDSIADSSILRQINAAVGHV